MLTIERVGATIRRGTKGVGGVGAIPLLARIGLVVLVFGGFADLTAHVAAFGPAAGTGGTADHTGGHTPDEVAAHVVVFVGMVVILLGVVVDGAKRSRLARRVGGE